MNVIKTAIDGVVIIEPADLARTLDEAGTQRGLQIRAQREDIFNAMHRI